MLRKICFFLFCFICFSSFAEAKDRYIYFLEDCSYNDLYGYENILKLLDKSVQGLGIQRSGGCAVSYFQSISKERPSNISLKEVPLYEGNEDKGNIFLKGFVEVDGTLYVPSKILLNGQTFDRNSNEKTRIFLEHVQDLQILDAALGRLEMGKDMEIILCSFSKTHRNMFENYIMPVVFYDSINRGIFYSETTRNKGIIDYENINSILSGDMSKLKIIDGDINRIYASRIKSLRDKRSFLTKYGLFMGILTMINSILLVHYYKKPLTLSSLFVIISPLSILVEPILNLDSIALKILVTSLFTLILCFYSIKKGVRWLPVSFLTLIYLDALFFRFLLRNSLLSYEPALGARYYGIGNEFLGVIIACILICISEFKITQTWMLWLINAVLLLYDGAGSNFGGFLTCTAIGFYMSPINLKLFWILAAAALIFLSNNHIGTFFRNIAAFNYDYIFKTIQGKLYTTKRLLKMNIWTELIITSVTIYIFNILRGKIKFNGNNMVFVISCILVVLFNDSGVVSCALIMMIYINYICYSLSLEDENGVC